MLESLGLDPEITVLVLAIAAGVLLVLAILLLVLWSLAKRRASRAEATISGIRRAALAAEADTREADSRLRTVVELQAAAAAEASAVAEQLGSIAVTAPSDGAAAARLAEDAQDRAKGLVKDLRRLEDVIRVGIRAQQSSGLREPATLDELLATYRSDGLTIDFRENGAPFLLRPGAAAAVHRIVDAALGNCLRHGGPGTHVSVELFWRADDLRIDVADDGARNQARLQGLDPDQAVRSADHALAYSVDLEVDGPTLATLRDTVAAFGGNLTAKEVPGVGFAFTASFPGLRRSAGRVHRIASNEAAAN